MFRRFRSLFPPETGAKDGIAGMVLGAQSVPDGLAGGLLAGVNPVYGLYGYLFGMLGAAFVTSSEFMTVQATGAMAAVVADVSEVHNGDDAERALFTLALLTGVIMLIAGIPRGIADRRAATLRVASASLWNAKRSRAGPVAKQPVGLPAARPEGDRAEKDGPRLGTD